MSNQITEVTRRAIFDVISASAVEWSGRLAEDDFLSRLYDLTALPSHDHRFPNAAGDIWKHRVMNLDWNDDWVFYDSRFNLLRVSDDEFLRFLCETLHPVVRPDSNAARELAAAYNQELQADGWRLIEIKQISGHPVFGAQREGQRVQMCDEPTGWRRVDRQCQEVRLRLDTASSEEQYQAVGLLCREVLISVAQEVFAPEQHDTDIPVSETDAKRMLEAIFDAELRGGANEEARAHAKAAVRLALALQHKRTADFRTAALCAEATFSVVNMLAVIAGRRGRLS